MDGWLFSEYIKERILNKPYRYGLPKNIYTDNYSGKNDTSTSTIAIEILNKTIRNLPPNATNLCQPDDYFIISKVKETWKR